MTPVYSLIMVALLSLTQKDVSLLGNDSFSVRERATLRILNADFPVCVYLNGVYPHLTDPEQMWRVRHIIQSRTRFLKETTVYTQSDGGRVVPEHWIEVLPNGMVRELNWKIVKW